MVSCGLWVLEWLFSLWVRVVFVDAERGTLTYPFAGGCGNSVDRQNLCPLFHFCPIVWWGQVAYYQGIK